MTMTTTTTMEKMVIIGGGPAGLTAAIYGAMANLSPLVLEGFAPGGQLMETTRIENFPGFPGGIDGPRLMGQMREQAERLGARLIPEDVVEARLEPRGHAVRFADREIRTLCLIIATGAKARTLGVEGELDLAGRGVSYCATCDGFFFKGKNVVVIGGGDSALEEAIYLAGLCRKVSIVHRRDRMRACPALVDRARKVENVGFILEHVPRAFVPTADGLLGGVKLQHVGTGEAKTIEADGAFIAVGHSPQSDLFKGQLDLNANGYIVTSKGAARTSVEGVYAAGDVQDSNYQQAITAAGSGCVAARDAIRYLETMI
jgi:thioredoxin reductase (NADPH)